MRAPREAWSHGCVLKWAFDLIYNQWVAQQTNKTDDGVCQNVTVQANPWRPRQHPNQIKGPVNTICGGIDGFLPPRGGMGGSPLS
jgi:hypothetical protein